MTITVDDLEPAKQAVKFLIDTANFDVNNVASFVITPKMKPNLGSIQTPVPVVFVSSTDTIFAAMKTAFGNYVTNKRTQATNLLTSLGITM